jgi:two-component system OmpR family response regulator
MLKILVAEDDPCLRRYIEGLLTHWDCEVQVEENGEGAIRRAATFQPDIALLGLVMPGIGGDEAGVGLLKVSAGTQVVLMVEPVPPKTLDRLRKQGYDFETLTAPFTQEELHALLFGGARARDKPVKGDV